MNDCQSHLEGGSEMEDKKRSITLSAINVFQEKGIEKTTVSEIVKGAGIAQGTFYLYFPSKLSVMPAIAEVLIERTLLQFKEKFDASTTFTTQLRKIIDIVFDYTKKYHDLYAMIYVGMGSNKQLNQWESIYEPYYELVSDIVKKAQENNEVSQAVSSKEIAIMLIGFIESAADQSYLFDLADAETVRIKKENLMILLLHGFIPSF